MLSPDAHEDEGEVVVWWALKNAGRGGLPQIGELGRYSGDLGAKGEGGAAVVEKSEWKGGRASVDGDDGDDGDDVCRRVDGEGGRLGAVDVLVGLDVEDEEDPKDRFEPYLEGRAVLGPPVEGCSTEGMLGLDRITFTNGRGGGGVLPGVCFRGSEWESMPSGWSSSESISSAGSSLFTFAPSVSSLTDLVVQKLFLDRAAGNGSSSCPYPSLSSSISKIEDRFAKLNTDSLPLRAGSGLKEGGLRFCWVEADASLSSSLPDARRVPIERSLSNWGFGMLPWREINGFDVGRTRPVICELIDAAGDFDPG